ncbi:MAG: MFS transporter [Firmicutes bacterium]|nr:MFS transporter [Bacillota bacterium]
MNTSPSLYTPQGWRTLHPSARQLIAARFLRSIAQGALGVDFTLYLGVRGWSAPEVGALLMAGGLAGAVLSLWVGVYSDRVGRKGFLLFYEAGLALGTAAILLFPAAWLLVVTGALFGFGRGANGASGPFAPAEQAWLAQNVPGKVRGKVFSFNAALQFWGMGIGSLLAAVLPHMIPGLSAAAAYMPMFILNLLMAIINFVQIKVIPEARPGSEQAVEESKARDRQEIADRPEGATTATSGMDDAQIRRHENRALTLLTLVNMTNSLGVGIVAPLLPYWFHLKFGVGPEAIGPVYSLTFVLTGLSSLYIGRMSERIGLTKSIIFPRLIGILTLIAMPFMPYFWLAAILYVLRSIVNRGSVGARQAFSVSLVRDQRRGMASSLNAVSWNVPAAFGPAIGGWLIGSGSLILPFALASVFQLAYIVLFGTVLGRYEERPPAAPKPPDPAINREA